MKKSRPNTTKTPRQFIVPKSDTRFLNVIFEDNDILVIDKPPGVLSEPKSDSPHSNLLGMVQGYLRRKFKDSKGSYVKLLHRLDKDTTGVIVVAKSKLGEKLEDQFRDHKVERHYVAIVEGAIQKESGRINLPLEKGDFKGGQKARVAENDQGKRAVTFYEVRERYANASLLDVRVETGRTHQVRVHMAHIGHPLVGDKIYGANQIPFKRHALHAKQLGFLHPRTGIWVHFNSKLPQDMEELIDRLRGF